MTSSTITNGTSIFSTTDRPHAVEIFIRRPRHIHERLKWFCIGLAAGVVAETLAVALALAWMMQP